jgi:hypothetical protein
MTVIVVNRVDVGSAREDTRAAGLDAPHAQRKIARRLALAWVALAQEARSRVPAGRSRQLLSQQR